MKTVTSPYTWLLTACVSATPSLCANAATPPIYKTSFDCAQTRVAVEKLICRDAQLAQMDLELMRLYLLALTDEHSVPLPDKVAVEQQFWIDERNQCATGAEPKACTIRRYAERAYQLRQGSAIVRTKDPYRLTEGPVVFSCAGGRTLLSATYFTVQPGVVYLKWASASVTLNQVPSSTETLYRGKDYKGNYSFRETGSEVFFQLPGASEMSCMAVPVN